ncbi:MAG: hypothetical protein ACREOG_20455 [Gemmatimonadaceae bacterium]
MSRLLKIGAGAAAVVVASLALVADPTRGWADSPLCRPTGCPSGAQLCATITAGVPGVGSVTYYCYQPIPGGGGGTKPPVY